jgi:hypothetical protein
MLKTLRRRWNELLRQDRLDRESQVELAHHLELAAAEKVRGIRKKRANGFERTGPDTCWTRF